jgi:cytoskeletal protein CcmA (bactofilin family)
MWKFGKDEQKPAPPVAPTKTPAISPLSTTAAVSSKEASPVEPSKPAQPHRADVASIGKSVVIKGELSGSEDLYVDGEVEGSIELRGHSLIVGPNGRVRANVHARDIIIHGKVDGNLYGGERVELRKTAVLVGDIATQRIAIEDGAFFKGGIDVQKSDVKPQQTAAVAANSAAVSSPPVQNGPAPQNAPAQTSLIESK